MNLPPLALALLLLLLAPATLLADITPEEATAYAANISASLSSFACGSARVGGARCPGQPGIHEAAEAYETRYEEASVSGAAVADALEAKLETYFDARSTYLLRLRDATEAAFRGEVPEDSANVDTLFRMGFGTRAPLLPAVSYQETFMQEVSDPSSGSSAYRVPGSADRFPSSTPTRSLATDVRRDVGVSARLDPVFRQNYAESVAAGSPVRWQYFGSVNGVFRQHPAVASAPGAAASTYADYDPRLRGWYVGSSSGPKDVVIVLDKSGSMSAYGRAAKARDAAVSVLSTLSSEDFVQIVTFNGASTQLECLGRRLVRATPVNVAKLTEFVRAQMASVSGGTNFEAGFAHAFDLLEATDRLGNGSNCHRAILFLTDGDAADPTETVVRRNAAGELGVRVFSFTIGEQANDAAALSVACATGGAYRHISDSENLLDAMSTYYVFYAYGIVGRSATWTAPYVDANGLGLMVTGAIGVYLDGNLLGVVGIDITVAEIVNEIGASDGSLGPGSYAFLASSDGDAIYHPRLASPGDLDDGSLEHFEDIDTLEGPEFAASNARRDMVEGVPSVTWVEGVRRFVPRGDSLYEGLQAVERNVLYLVRPVGVTPYRVGFAANSPSRSDEALVTVRRLREGVPLPPVCGGAGDAGDGLCRVKPDLYHELELIERYAGSAGDGSRLALWAAEANATRTPLSYPLHPNATLTPRRAVFKLAPGVFQSPRAYLAASEAPDELEALYTLVNEDAPASPLPGGGFSDDGGAGSVGLSRAQVLNGVYLTSAAEPMWREADESGLYDYTAWRYVATVDGVHRLYPGSPVERDYTPQKRPWYSRALANQGLFAVSTPYVDFFAGAVVVTLSSTVVGSGSPTAGEVAAVAGADLQYGSFEDLVMAAAPGCGADPGAACFIVDSSGMMVTDPRFRGETTNERLENVFMGSGVSEALLAVAEDLISAQGVLRRHTFTSYETYSVSVSYEVVPPEGGWPVQGNTVAGQYVMSPVAGTNLYLLVVNAFNALATCSARVCAEARVRPGCLVEGGQCASVDVDACEINQTRFRVGGACPTLMLDDESLEALRRDEGALVCGSGGSGAGGGGGGEESSGGSGGAVAGAVVGALVALGAVVALCVFCARRNKRKQAVRNTRRLRQEHHHATSAANRARYNAEYAMSPPQMPAYNPAAAHGGGGGGMGASAPAYEGANVAAAPVEPPPRYTPY